MIMPNMKVAEDRHSSRVTLFWDAATKQYGLRYTEEQIKDGVHIEADKNIILTKEQLLKLMDDAKTFLEKDRG